MAVPTRSNRNNLPKTGETRGAAKRRSGSKSHRVVNARIPKELESSVQDSTVDLLAIMGITLWRRNVGAFHVEDRYIRCAEPGQSDLWGTDDRLIGGIWARHWEIETKRPGKRPTPEQRDWLKASTARGWVAFWGDNIDSIIKVATAILAGGRIVWREGPGYHRDGADFDVEM